MELHILLSFKALGTFILSQPSKTITARGTRNEVHVNLLLSRRSSFRKKPGAHWQTVNGFVFPLFAFAEHFSSHALLFDQHTNRDYFDVHRMVETRRYASDRIHTFHAWSSSFPLHQHLCQIKKVRNITYH